MQILGELAQSNIYQFSVLAAMGSILGIFSKKQ
jgi:hypothetical protein